MGYFELPNLDGPGPYVCELNCGYFLAFDPADTLWVLDANPLSPSGSFPLWRTTSNGSVLDFVLMDLPDALDACHPGYTNCYPQSMAVDSAGFGYVTLYSIQGVFVINQQLQLVTRLPFAGPQYPSVPYGYDLEMSISWGSTPSSDLIYTYGYLRPPIAVMSPTGALVGQVNIDPSYSPTAVVYDAYLDSFLIANSLGSYSVVRVNQVGLVIAQFLLGFAIDALQGSPLIVYGLAGDGSGHAAFAGTAADGITPQLWMFHGATQLWLLPVGLGGGVAIDPTAQLVWVPSAVGGTTLEAYSYSGSLLRSLTAADAVPIPYWMSFRPDMAGGNGSLVQCDGHGDVISSVSLSTGAVTVLYNGFEGGVGPESQVSCFSYSADSSVLYLAGSSTASTGGAIWAVDTASGAVIAELDLQGNGGLLVATNSSGSVIVPVNGNSLILVYPAVTVTAPSSSSTGVSRVIGDPQFIGLRGQSFQVHGLDKAVYNLIVDDAFMLNARFTFLESGRCPAADLQLSAACWTHPGSYLGEVGLAMATGQQLVVRSGDAVLGFTSVTLNNTSIAVGEWRTDGMLSAHRLSTHSLRLSVDNFQLTVENSDMFINLASVTVRDWGALRAMRCHGLLGQTWRLRRRRGLSLPEVDGQIDDYVELNDQLLGDQFTSMEWRQHDAE